MVDVVAQLHGGPEGEPRGAEVLDEVGLGAWRAGQVLDVHGAEEPDGPDGSCDELDGGSLLNDHGGS